jgi:hypothetical protein
MKIRCLSLAAALAVALAPSAVLSQASAPAVSAAPKAAKAKSPPRLLTPEESRDSATAPGDLRPEHQVTQQVNIPLGRKAPSKPDSSAVRRGKAASGGGINDAAARCNAEVDEQARASCRDRVAH